MSYETVIGLEVHAQLLTKSKLFCGCSTQFGASANTHTCERCLGMPGVLPVLNRKAVELAARAAAGLECTIHARSQWSRKNYFYPDLPKGYQVTQYDKPIATGGKLAIMTEAGGIKVVGVTRIHMEEDAGKNVHDDALAGERSYVDYNRSGVGLVEIVSEPDMRSSEEAVAYLKALRQILRHLEVCDGNMEEGSLRCDANVSIRKVGQKEFGTRVELKNINSFRFVQAAIEYEVMRQAEVLDSGGSIRQETRLWDTQAKVTRAMRSKEDAHDYRYFPEPDLPDLVLNDAFIEGIKQGLPELPAARLIRYVETLGLSSYDAGILTDDHELSQFFETAIAKHNNVKAIANWIINDLLRELRGKTTLPFAPEALAELVSLIDDNTISGKIAKEVFVDMLQTGKFPKEIVEAKGLKQVTDTSAIEPLVDQILTANADSVQKLKEGKTNIQGFLVGLVLKASGGKANPKMVNELIRKKIGL
jgi:aspartyl-tRNA(Asn)/glutamyl-tRNA(Gln) amidotransferase subunit B